MNIYTIILACICCVLYKILVNFCRWRRLKKYRDLYIDYTKKDKNLNNWEIVENKAEIKNLFKRAGLESFSITTLQPVGCGHAQTYQLDLFENLATREVVGNTNIPSTIINYFYEGIGIYKARIKEALSIFFWLDTVIFLPQKIINYLGFSITTGRIRLISKVLNFIYWVLWVIFVIVLPIFGWHLIILIKIPQI